MFVKKTSAKKTVAKKAPAKKAAKSASASKRSATKRSGKAQAKANARTGTGYKGHREGSRKEKAHMIFDKTKDIAKAKAEVQKLKIKPTTIGSWFSSFRKTA